MPSFLVSPDSFKGTLSAGEVAEAVCRGVRSAGEAAIACPLADGGEGTSDVLLTAAGGERVDAGVVHDPLGRPIHASFALLADGRTAVVDVAEASGLTLVSDAERDAESADTRGTGELIAAAIAEGATHVKIAAGGSATTDGGRGAVAALKAAGGIGATSLEVLCDVTTPFEQAANVFAMQKGADAAAVTRLTTQLNNLAEELPRDPRGLPMTGAAGGLAGGLWATFGAVLTPGADFVLASVGFARLLAEADVVITGEGRIDEQSLHGKVVGRLAAICGQAGKEIHVVVGRDELDRAALGGIKIASIRVAGTIDALEAVGEALASQRVA